jgi:catechol 2,3-dioxygenase-like lactoylglutathione lyase family enzyme
MLHHIALGARDVEEVAAFYEEMLGLRELRRHHRDDGTLRSIWLELGEGVLMVEATSGERRRVDGVGRGLFLLALRAIPGERQRAEERLERGGYPIESRTEHTCYFRDPEGNRVALSDYPLDHRD